MGLEKEAPKLEDQVFSSQFFLSPVHSWVRVAQRIILAVLLGVFLLASAAKAQEDAAAAQMGRGTRQSSVSSPVAKGSHPFWAKDNIVLFAGVGAGRALDYASTRHFRDRGVNEWLLTNNIVDNKPLFAGLEVAGVAASIGVSYLFHRSGHHKIEQWVSIVHIGAGVAGSAWNYTLKRSPPPSAAH
jgi:drug/metabolite transporter (DMT)-like permease